MPHSNRETIGVAATGELIFRRYCNLRVIEAYESWASRYSRISGDEGLSVSGFALFVRQQCRLWGRNPRGPALYSVSPWNPWPLSPI